MVSVPACLHPARTCRASPSSITRTASDEAEAIADLLWFPTGGGKTEAYLGLSAYTMGLRRLQGIVAGRSGEYGVAVLMRYTLRLLTIQQFQRATALICACEVIRRDDEKTWGKEPFRIGLWVGQKTTPNTTEAAAEAIQQEHGGRPYKGRGSGSPAQLTNCPWCGAKIDPGRDIKVESLQQGPVPHRHVTAATCWAAARSAAKNSPLEGIPVLVVDEEIYRRLPTLLIATVDKFAQMPWNGKVQMLFGQVDGYCARHGFRSPEIEDADSHPKKDKYPPAKTIEHPLLAAPRPDHPGRAAPDQRAAGHARRALRDGRGQALLLGGERQGGPAQGHRLDGDDPQGRGSGPCHVPADRSASSRPTGSTCGTTSSPSSGRPSEELPGRRYIGICAPGRRLKVALIRVYVALLSAAQTLYEKKGYGKDVDPWMTLIGYFNSMRELGGMRRLVDDDVRTRLRKMDQRGLARRFLYVGRRTDLPQGLDGHPRSARPSGSRLSIPRPRPSARRWRSGALQGLAQAAARRAPGDEHGLGRRGRAAARPDGRRRSAQDDGRVHSGDQPGRA